MSATKKCIKCDEVKPLEAFYQNGGTSDGRLGTCRTCCRLKQKQYRQQWERHRQLCDCGNPATVTKNGTRICERCDEIDGKFEMRAAPPKRESGPGLGEFRVAMPRRMGASAVFNF